jgi:flagellar hook protein FlgE
LVVDYLRSDTPNQWYAEVRADPPDSVETDPNLAPGLICSGVVAFNPDGSIDAANTTLPASLSIGASSATPPAAGSGEAGVQWSEGIGVESQTIAMDLSKMSQFSAVSSVASVSTNGTAFGSIAGLSIDDNGFVTAVYDNGTTRRIAEVAVATFPNPDGLKAVNGNAYEVSLNSGGFTLKAPGSAGAGDISPSSLEASTVDLSQEFTGLITTQRAYAASSKIITTADQMLQELISIKQ